MTMPPANPDNRSTRVIPNTPSKQCGIGKPDNLNEPNITGGPDQAPTTTNTSDTPRNRHTGNHTATTHRQYIWIRTNIMTNGPRWGRGHPRSLHGPEGVRNKSTTQSQPPSLLPTAIKVAASGGLIEPSGSGPVFSRRLQFEFHAPLNICITSSGVRSFSVSVFL